MATDWPPRALDRCQRGGGYAKFYSRSHDDVIRVYDEASNAIETHEHTSDFKDWWAKPPRS